MCVSKNEISLVQLRAIIEILCLHLKHLKQKEVIKQSKTFTKELQAQDNSSHRVLLVAV